MTHPVGVVEYDASLLAWVLDLPGCVAGARDDRQLDDCLPLAIAEHEAWLGEHGEPIASDADWQIVERGLPDVDGDRCFDADRQPMTAGDLERLIRRAGYARDDLLRAVALLPDRVLDWQPPRSAFASFDAWAPDVRSIRELVHHALQLEAFYRGSLVDGPAVGVFERVRDAAAERGATNDLLRSLDPSSLARVYQPLHPGRTEASDWTVRKVMRRIISHDRVHHAEVLQRRSWLLLGVPAAGGDA